MQNTFFGAALPMWRLHIAFTLTSLSISVVEVAHVETPMGVPCIQQRKSNDSNFNVNIVSKKHALIAVAQTSSTAKWSLELKLLETSFHIAP